MKIRMKTLCAMGAIALSLSACGNDAVEPDATGATEEQLDTTLADLIPSISGASNAAAALEATGLDGIMQGEASYTVLAPNDAAFDALGEAGKELLNNEEQRAILAAVLREHILPGSLTPETIRTAIKENGGEVSMRSYGSGTVTFRMDGETVVATTGDGASATLMQGAAVGSNGAVIPVSGILVDPASVMGSAPEA